MAEVSFGGFSRREGSPIYSQIVRYIKAGIVAGTVADGDEFPSRRALSALLGVNPNTIQKAYRELERQGYIYTSSGVGTFVADKKSIVPDEEGLCKAKNAIGGAFRELLFLGLSYEEAYKIAIETIEERKNDL